MGRDGGQASVPGVVGLFCGFSFPLSLRVEQKRVLKNTEPIKTLCKRRKEVRCPDFVGKNRKSGLSHSVSSRKISLLLEQNLLAPKR